MHKFLIGILATWRLSKLLTAEDGPYDIFGSLRDRAGVTHDEYSQCVGKTEVAKALCCIKCTSVWVGLALAGGHPVKGLAYSAGAILIETGVLYARKR